MFFRLLLESFLRQRRRKALAGIAILLGTTAVTAMLALATTIGDRIHQELAVYGANIVITPRAANLPVKVGGIDIHPNTGNAYLKESDLEKLKTIFWANNITGISPELDLGDDGLLYQERTQINDRVQAKAVFFNYHFGNLTTGVLSLHPWWKIEGQIPEDYLKKFGYIEVLIGSRLATRLHLGLGDVFGYTPAQRLRIGPSFGEAFKIVGVLSSGDESENELIVPYIAIAPGLDRFSRVEISARTKPEDAFARRDPATLSPKDHDRWYCSPYANSIAFQIREAIPTADAQQLRQVEQSEGAILSRISGLMWLIAAAALLAAGFAVSAAMATAILERRAEIGLMRSLGASRAAIALLFYAETGLLSLLAGTLGYLLGSALAAYLGARIFTDTTTQIINTQTQALGSQTAVQLAATHTSALAAITHLSAYKPVLLPVVVAMALLVAIAGSTPSIRTALRMDPSTILRADA